MLVGTASNTNVGFKSPQNKLALLIPLSPVVPVTLVKVCIVT